MAQRPLFRRTRGQRSTRVLQRTSAHTSTAWWRQRTLVVGSRAGGGSGSQLAPQTADGGGSLGCGLQFEAGSRLMCVDGK
eukprot:6797551-Alexandrium_andersonii.AAC.1